MANIKKDFISILSNLTIGKHIATPTAAVNLLLANGSLQKDLYNCIPTEINKPGGTQHKVACLDFLLRLALESEKQENDSTVSYHQWVKQDFPEFFTAVLETTTIAPDSDVTISQSVLTRFTDNVKRVLEHYRRHKVLTDSQYEKYMLLLEKKYKIIANDLSAQSEEGIKEKEEKEVSKSVSSAEKRKFEEEVIEEDQDPAFASHRARQTLNEDVARKKQREENEKEETARTVINSQESSMVNIKEKFVSQTGDEALVREEEKVAIETETSTAAKLATLRDVKEPQDLEEEIHNHSEESFAKPLSQTQVIDEHPTTEEKSVTKVHEKAEREVKPEMKEPKKHHFDSGDRKDMPKEYAMLTLKASTIRPEEFQHRMNEDRDRCKKHKEHIWEIDYPSFGKFIEFENLWSTTPSSLRQHPEAAAVAAADDDEEGFHGRSRHRSEQKKKVKPRAEVIKRNILTALDYERMAEENKISQQALADDPLFYAK